MLEPLELPEAPEPDEPEPDEPLFMPEEPEEPPLKPEDPEEPEEPALSEEPDVPDDPPLLTPDEPDDPDEPDPLVPEVSEELEEPESLELGLLLPLPLDSDDFFLVELLPEELVPDVPEASDAPVALEPDEPELPPVEDVCATATPVPSAETRIAIKSLFIHCLHPWKKLRIGHGGSRDHSHALPSTCWMRLEASVIGSSWSILYQNVTVLSSWIVALYRCHIALLSFSRTQHHR